MAAITTAAVMAAPTQKLRGHREIQRYRADLPVVGGKVRVTTAWPTLMPAMVKP
ncbi:MAG: hypothetical protein U0821_00635 [Chloroflexota bacterium]